MRLNPEQAQRLVDLALRDEPGDAPVSTLLPPEIGPYRLVRLIGRGGMGEVYEAEQPSLRRRVALKTIRADLFDERASVRFEGEITLLAHLDHPGIARIHDGGLVELDHLRIPYCVMELVPGAMAIDDYARAHDLGLRERVELVRRVCEAVHHAHTRGVLHRDLKPGNILVADSGDPKVIDFGLARTSSMDHTLAMTVSAGSTLLGTLPYMSPEQLRADADAIDVRSETYSLGVALYELVCERLPYGSGERSMEAIAATLRGPEAPAPTWKGRPVPAPLRAVMQRAIERDPARRYPSADDLAEDLGRWLEGRPVQARAPGPWMRLTGWLGRHPVAAVAGLCALIALTTVVGLRAYASWMHHTPSTLSAIEGELGAVLYSRGGDILREWPVGGEYRGAFPFEARHPDAPLGWFGGLAFGRPNATPNFLLSVFDPRDPKTPLWTAPGPDFPVTPPKPLRDGQPVEVWSSRLEEWRAGPAYAADVFPERPGDEVICILHHNVLFPSMVAVCDAVTGEMLYRVWHTGRINAARWMPRSGLLVLVGVNNRIDYANLGYPEVPSSNTPLTVCAVRPRMGALMDLWITSPDVDAPARAEWLIYMRDPEISQQLDMPVIQPSLTPRSWEPTFRVRARVKALADRTPPYGSWLGPHWTFETATGRVFGDPELDTVMEAEGYSPDEFRTTFVPIAGFDPVGAPSDEEEIGLSPPR